MTINDFLKNEVDDFDADSNYIYLKLDKDRFNLPFMPKKSELKLWFLSNFAPCGDEDLRKELEVCKKALELACYEISEISGDTTKSLNSFYLQKAREEVTLQK